MGRTGGSGLRLISLGEERFTDLDFADDAITFAENMQSLVKSLTALSQESENLGLRVSWIKTKIQNFFQAVDQLSVVTYCGNTIAVLEVFPYLLGSQITADDSSDKDVHHHLGLA